MYIKLRSKPQKPIRQKVYDKVSLEDYKNFQEVLDSITKFADEVGITFEDIHVAEEWDELGDRYYYVLAWEYLESEESYQSKLAKYYKRLKVWQEWKEDNKKLIEKELDYREEQEEIREINRQVREEKAKERRKRALERQLKQIKKELAGE